MTAPYWQGDGITLYLGDCREVTGWLAADVLVTDPPYGRSWRQGPSSKSRGHADDTHAGITGDKDTTLRNWALTVWGNRLAVVFGDPLLPRPAGTKQVLAYRKPVNAGTRGTFGGFRRDLEDIYLVGPWVGGVCGRSSVLTSGVQSISGSVGPPMRYGHPHAKPVDVMETLIAACPPGTIADPFAGSGSTLVAARNQGRSAIGVEIDERYAERAARRLDQGILTEAGN